MSSFLGKANLSRGIRNNNPGNLVKTSDAWLGKVSHSSNTDGRFEQFSAVKYGIRAMLRDVINDILKGKNTVRKLIAEYAPPFENNTGNYVDSVAKKLGVQPDSKITLINASFMMMVAKAIIEKENGKDAKYIKDSDIRDAIRILGTFNAPKDVKIDTSVFAPVLVLLPLLLFFYTWFTVIL
ncbi:hypothetical protein [Flavobacterium sp. TSSA_36]|uniref:hypothetical protein n=1 Tax=Flavobacterium sp. TSSA_36 TaxID=3447669 RepID=UPI003F4031CD